MDMPSAPLAGQTHTVHDAAKACLMIIESITNPSHQADLSPLQRVLEDCSEVCNSILKSTSPTILQHDPTSQNFMDTLAAAGLLLDVYLILKPLSRPTSSNIDTHEDSATRCMVKLRLVLGTLRGIDQTSHADFQEISSYLPKLHRAKILAVAKLAIMAHAKKEYKALLGCDTEGFEHHVVHSGGRSITTRKLDSG
jgi:hypothetical protein